MTTYSLSLSFLEAVPMQALGQSRRDVTVLADVEGYRSSLSETGASNAGVGYEVAPVSVTGSGVFHPKITLLFSDSGELRALVGSGNLTIGGWGFNTEVGEYLTPRTDAEAFIDLADFLLSLGEAAAEGKRLTADRAILPTLENFADLCMAAGSRAAGGPTRLLHSVNEAIASQVIDLANEFGGAKKLTVLSPYFGGPGAVISLAKGLGCGMVQVAVPPKVPFWFDFGASKAAGLDAIPVKSDSLAPDRLLHAKALDIECAGGRLVISGSANATVNGLGIDASAGIGSVEAVVARFFRERTWLGWSMAGYPANTVGEGGSEPVHGGAPCLTARLDGTGLKGRILDVSKPAGTWMATLYAPGRYEDLGAVDVDEDGSFFSSDLKIDAATLFSSLQLFFSRGEQKVRGWLVMTEIVDAVRERGALAEAMARAAAGHENSNDSELIAGFFRENPDAFLIEDTEVSKVAGGTSEQTTPTRLLRAEELKPSDAITAAGKGVHQGSGQSAFQRMILRFRKRIAGGSPRQLRGNENDSADGGSDGREGSNFTSSLTLLAAIDAISEKVATMTPGQAKREHVLSVLDFILYAASSVEDPDQVIKTRLPAWQRLAKQAGRRKEGADALDRCIAIAIFAPNSRDATKASSLHKRLQIWFGGTLSDEQAASIGRPPAGHRELQLAPDIGSAEWRMGIASVLAAETSWQRNRRLLDALDGKCKLPDLSAVSLPEERSAFEKIVNGKGRRGNVIERRSWDHCPGCNMKLARVEAGRLRKEGIASCRQMKCSTIIVDVVAEEPA